MSLVRRERHSREKCQCPSYDASGAAEKSQTGRRTPLCFSSSLRSSRVSFEIRCWARASRSWSRRVWRLRRLRVAHRWAMRGVPSSPTSSHLSRGVPSGIGAQRLYITSLAWLGDARLVHTPNTYLEWHGALAGPGAGARRAGAHGWRQAWTSGMCRSAVDFARDFALHFAWRAAAKSALGTGLGMLLLADFVVAKHTIKGASMQARPSE